MDCEHIQKNRLLQCYLAGQLTPDEAQEIEMHIMACDSCFQTVQIQEKLSAYYRTTAIPPLAAKPKRFFALSFQWRLSYSLFLVFTIILAAAAVLLQRRELPKNYAYLARIEAPVFIPNQNRAPDQINPFQQNFDAGISAYQKQQYVQAVKELRLAVQHSPGNPKAGYYLGVSYLLAGNLEAAASAFERVIELRNSCFNEDCRWFLANTYLLMGKTDAALEQLQLIYRLNQNHQKQAGEIIRAIDPKLLK